MHPAVRCGAGVEGNAAGPAGARAAGRSRNHIAAEYPALAENAGSRAGEPFDGLLLGSGLFLQTVRNLSQADPGFDSRRLLHVLVDPRGSGYQPDQIGRLYRRLAERLAAIPGVESVTGVRNSILRGRLSGWTEVEQVEVGPAFFETMRIPLVNGRYLAELDNTLAGFDAAPTGDHNIQLPSRVVIRGPFWSKFWGHYTSINSFRTCGTRVHTPTSTLRKHCLHC